MHVSKFVNLAGSNIQFNTSVVVESQFIADIYDPKSNIQSIHIVISIKSKVNSSLSKDASFVRLPY